ncbi:CLUMA_CG020403, isoform A [Clunio marinus]|uniref:CLUMA_CG020403, isoform A n=1 Tax=Clunio marinus TaxID=568069 RepID=A0A1J1J613_9DIPT|nr:CLUMA_CG020403, isoform A [Clunio marinus]
MLPKETETNKNVGSAGVSKDNSTIVSSDILMDNNDQQQQITTETDDSPKLEQILLDSFAAAVTSTASTTPLGFQNGGVTQTSQNTNDPPEMPQLMSILNELLDGQDLASLANTGGNGDNMQDIVDQEENYEEDSPKKDDPEELTRLLVQQRLEEISREEQQLQRRMDFLIRRLYKLVTRSTSVHASEEIAGFLEHVTRHNLQQKEKDLQHSSSISLKFPCLTANLQEAPIYSPNKLTLENNPFNLLSSPPASSQEVFEKQNISEFRDESESMTTKKPVSIGEMKSFLRQIGNLSTLQNTVLNKRSHALKYFSKPFNNSLNSLTKTEASIKSNIIPRFESVDTEQLDQISGLLASELRLIEKQIDSDATASSSGGESADEMISYNNSYQQSLPLSQRSAYKYAKDRGSVASRWCWLATQISELDYKIRQHTDLRKHIKDSKNVVTLEDASILEGKLSGNCSKDSTCIISDDEEGNRCSSARVRPLVKSAFRKRKLVQIANLHTISKKAGRPSTLKCSCHWPYQPCALCTGRGDPTEPRDLPDTLQTAERVALLDPGFHPVLSFADDVSNNIHLEAIMNITEWQSKMIRSSPKSIMKHASKQLENISAILGSKRTFKNDYVSSKLNAANNERKNRKGNIDAVTGKRKYTKKIMKLDGLLTNKLKDRKKHRKRNSMVCSGNPHVPRKYTFKKRLRKLNSDAFSHSNQNSNHNLPNYMNGGSEKHFEYICRSKNSSPVPNNRSEKKTSESRSNRNYDIDNIVIPYSIAASTRVEVLSYKEIPTPKWRIINDTDELEQLMVEQDLCNQSGEYPENEDISDEYLTVNHDKALIEERRKFETYLKFPLTSRSRANRRVDSRGNESSGTNTPTPDPTSPAPALSVGDLESIPSPLDNHEYQETPSITAILNNLNGRKDRSRLFTKRDDGQDGPSSGTASRCISPEAIKETIPAYEPLRFPLTDLSLQKMKRVMPSEHLKQVERHFNIPSQSRSRTDESQMNHNHHHHHQAKIINCSRQFKKARKHNDSISESKLIKEKLPSSSFTTIGRNNNILIPRNNHNILESIDLTATDGAVLKELMNNNNCDLNFNGGLDDDDDNDTEELCDSDSETVTGDESFIERDDESESEDYITKDDRKQPYKTKNVLISKQ